MTLGLSAPRRSPRMARISQMPRHSGQIWTWKAVIDFQAWRAELDKYGLKGANVASSSIIDLGAATGFVIDITGTTPITALGTAPVGTCRLARFTGSLVLTHNATSLILPGGANITTQPNAAALLISLGTGNWWCAIYQRSHEYIHVGNPQWHTEHLPGDEVYWGNFPGSDHRQSERLCPNRIFNRNRSPVKLRCRAKYHWNRGRSRWSHQGNSQRRFIPNCFHRRRPFVYRRKSFRSGWRGGWESSIAS